MLFAAAALVLCLSGTARGQADSARRPAGPTPVIRLRTADSSSALDVDNVEVIKTGAFWAFDRIGPLRRRTMLDSLEAQRKLWADRRPRVYSIRLVVINDCLYVRTRPRVDGKLLLDRLVVSDTTVVRRAPAPIPRRFEQFCPRTWRVDDLFADVANALSDTTARITDIRYDEVYGFPRAYWVVRGRSRGEWVIVESFAPAP